MSVSKEIMIVAQAPPQVLTCAYPPMLNYGIGVPKLSKFRKNIKARLSIWLKIDENNKKSTNNIIIFETSFTK